MKKFYEKEPIWFAVLWIGIYVLGFSNADSLSDTIGIPKLLTVPVGLVISLVLWGFLRKNRLFQRFGLCKGHGNRKQFLWYLPLVAITTVNLWNGVRGGVPFWEGCLHVISMCFVGFLEEVIFRGLLFQGMRKTGVIPAVIVSSLTFGMGHIVNLLLGEPVLDTALQLIYASAVGFCYTACFLAGGSILPCILSHVLINSTSIFAPEPTRSGQILTAAVQTVLGVGYGLWLLRVWKRQEKTG